MLTAQIAYDALALAFLGDATYAFLTRNYLVKNFNGKIGMLHKTANKFVSAKGQAKVYDKIKPLFTEEEKEVARRARNIHVNNVPKSVDLETYKKATSLEAVFGYNTICGLDRGYFKVATQMYEEGELN